MNLTKKQVLEIVRFDWVRRTGGEYDGRRYGSITGSNAPRMTQDWTPCYGVNPQDERNGIERKKVCRKTLRYNYIIPAKTRNAKTRDVTVVHVAVRLDQYYVPVVKDVARFHTATGITEMRDMDYKGIAGWCVEWSSADYRGKKPTGRAPAPRLAKAVERIVRKCELCGKEFTVGRMKEQRFCSSICNKRAYRIKQGAVPRTLPSGATGVFERAQLRRQKLMQEVIDAQRGPIDELYEKSKNWTKEQRDFAKARYLKIHFGK